MEHLLVLDVSYDYVSKVQIESCYQPADVNISKCLVYCKSESKIVVSIVSHQLATLQGLHSIGPIV